MGVQLPEPAAAVNAPEAPTKPEQLAVDKGEAENGIGKAAVLKNGVQVQVGDTTEDDAKAAAVKVQKEVENGKENEKADAEDDEDGDDEDFQAAEDDDAEKEGDEEEEEDEDSEDDEEDDDGEDGEETIEGAQAKMGLSTEIVSQFLTKEHIGGRALLAAAKEDDVETISKLFEANGEEKDVEKKEGEGEKGEKIDIDAKDPFDYTALHLAAENGAVNAVRKLISLKASLELPTRMHQCRPLHYAASNGHAEVIQALLDGGADINSRTDDGRTSLMQAVLSGHVECVKVLMKNKADASITSDDGKAPADVAESREMSDALEAPAEKKARTE